MRPSSKLLGLGLALLGVIVWAPAVHAGILDATWSAPTTNADGSPLTDLASYKLYYGTSPVTCPGGSTFVTVPSPTTSPTAGTTVSYQLTGLQTGTTYYVGVTAVDTSGNEGACSNQATAPARIDVSAPPSLTLTVVVAGSSYGTVTSSPASISCGSTCVTTLAPSSTITLTATSGTNAMFLGWSGGACTGTGTCAFTATSDTTVVASFASLAAVTRRLRRRRAGRFRDLPAEHGRVVGQPVEQRWPLRRPVGTAR